MTFFTLEYIARLTVNPCKCDFVKQPLNIIDLLTILPFFAEECLPLLGVYDIELRNIRGFYFNKLTIFIYCIRLTKKLA